MILGIGTDLANIDRIQGVLSRHGDRFRNRVFTETEQAKASRRKDEAGTYAKRGAVYAQENGFFEKYVEVVFKSMWVDNKKMDDIEVIQSVLKENELPTKDIFEGTQDQNVKNKLIENTNYAVEQGAFGAPSFLIDGELFFGKETLQDVEDLILSKTG